MRLPQTAREAIETEIAGLQAQIDEYQKLLDMDTSASDGAPTSDGKKGGMSEEQRAKQRRKMKKFWREKKKKEAEAQAALPTAEELNGVSGVGLVDVDDPVPAAGVSLVPSQS